MTDPDIEAACEDIAKGLKTRRECSADMVALLSVEQLAIRHLTNWGADARHASMLAAFANELLRAPAARVPKVRTSHHRNKEEAARLQELVAKRYAAPRPYFDGDLVNSQCKLGDYCKCCAGKPCLCPNYEGPGSVAQPAPKALLK